MLNKSINSKGLSRQLEERTHDLQIRVDDLRNQNTESDRNAKIREQRLQKENERLQWQCESTSERIATLSAEMQQATKEINCKSEEKDLLHTRHDALTIESANLQNDLLKSQARLHELEQRLDEEREHALNNDRHLRDEARTEIDHLNDKLSVLRRQLEESKSQHASDLDQWESQRRSLESKKDKASERAAGLERTVGKLQEAEGTLSGREHKLQEALESEKRRHKDEEAVHAREIQELDTDINSKRTTIEDLRCELSQIKEELRVSTRNTASSEEKIQALDDEIAVLQEEYERAQKEIAATRQEAESSRRELDTVRQGLSRAEAAHLDARTEIKKFQDDLQAGLGSSERVNSRLRDVESQLLQVKTDKQSFQDKLASANIEIHTLQASIAETEAERDEVKRQLRQTESQIEKSYKPDQEKIDLRKAKLRLDSDLSRLREERDSLVDKSKLLEHELEEEVRRAGEEEARLKNELAELRGKLATASDARDRELTAAKQRSQRFENKVTELENRLLRAHEDVSADPELSMLQRDISAARKKETEYLQRETTHKEAIRDFKQRISSLERKAHEAEVLKHTADSPKSSVGSSGQKSEIEELRRQLLDAQQQLKDSRLKSRESERELRQRLSDFERQAQANVESLEQQREELEQDLLSTRHSHESQQVKLDAAEKTISRLRARIQTVEASLRSARQDNTSDRTMADERKDLHEMLKEAKVEAEDLQLQISAGQARLKTAMTRETEVRTHLQRVRNERNHQQKQSSALTAELENLQLRYERAVNRFAKEQKKWQDERKSIVSRVRFPNTSISEVKEDENADLQALQQTVRKKEEHHAGEIRGLATQIRWLRAKWERELEFRQGLSLQKRYLGLRCEMYEAWYVVFCYIFPFPPLFHF